MSTVVKYTGNSETLELNFQYTEQNQKYIKVQTKEVIQSQDKTTIFIKIKE